MQRYRGIDENMFSEKYGTEVGGITTQSRITVRILLQKEFLSIYFDE
jgi:hypothetical protein